MSKQLSKGAKIGIGLGTTAAVGAGIGLGVYFALQAAAKKKEGGAPTPPGPTPPGPPTPAGSTETWDCDPRSGTPYLCSKKPGGPFTAETCAPGDTKCKPCACVMPMMVSSTSGGGGGTTPETTCQCGYTDAAYTGGGLPKYHSYDECINDPAQKCGWGYGCDCTDPSEFKCTFKPGGMWKSQADCRCYCPPDGGDGGGSTGGTTEQMGWRCDASSTSPSGCSYVPGGPYATEADCRCFYAQGAFGPDCTCVRTESNMPASDTRAFPTMDACTSSTSFECGWKYGCDGSTVRTCSLKPSGSGGVWQKSSECVCGPPVLNWSCDPTTADPTKCVQVAFDTGQFETQEKCSCWACDASSTDPTKCSAVAAGAKGAAHTQAGCSCVYAVGNAGPGCECKYDPLLAPTVAADKQFNNMLACSRDYKSKCGWKYTCAAYGTVLQCADLNNQFYLVDDASQSLRLLTDVTGPTYDPDYKTKAVYTDCGFYNYTIGSPALAKQQ